MENKKIKIALAGNPNSGKTTLFNILTGSNQYVGNWPGVTVEKKEGKLKKHENVVITDLPGIYSLSPYTLEEVVSREYLVNERPDVVINVVDGTNLERNLYLTTQLIELGIPLVLAINMMDQVKKNGDKIEIKELSRRLGCKIIEISALKGSGINELVDAAISVSKEVRIIPPHIFTGPVEHALAHIEEALLHDLPEEKQRWYAVKIFERDEKVIKNLNISQDKLNHVENDIRLTEKELDDDAESIITNERYVHVGNITKGCYRKRDAGSLSVSDKIDRIITNRFLGLPIFAVIMFLVYYISMVTIGTYATDWANDGLFGEGWFLFGIGSKKYNESSEEYFNALNVIDAFGLTDIAEERGYDGLQTALLNITPNRTVKNYAIKNEEDLTISYVDYNYSDLLDAVNIYNKYNGIEPAPEDYGVWVKGIPVLVGNFFDSISVSPWLSGLIIDGIIAGVGAVLGFLPQILVLFLLLAILEGCGYMARIAFVLDRIFRRFGLSGKSFIPMLIGSGCGVPGIMASRTIENLSDRRMTIITTTFIPCSAKIPIISMIAGLLFDGSALVAVSAYFIGMFSIVVSGIILKKTRLFSGEPSPFIMELPSYHLPTVKTVLSSMWERGFSFVKKAGTIILLSTVLIWFLSHFGIVEGEGFRLLENEEIKFSILAFIGRVLSFIFIPLGWGDWRPAVASITGLIAKENIVGTMSILFGSAGIIEYFTKLSGFSFLLFNLLCAPCFAAMGAIKREMNNKKWTFFAILYECLFAYVVSFMVYQIGSVFTESFNILGFILAISIFLVLIYNIFRKEGKK